MSDNQVIGWDDDVSEEMVEKKQTDFTILPDGEYPFRVAKVAKGQYNGSAKIPACGMVTVGIVLSDAFYGDSYVPMRFFMVKSCLWKIYEFLTSIGLHKAGNGSNGPIPWNKVDTSCTGRAKVTTRKYTANGKECVQNDVKTFLAPAQEEY